ncbi:hypothetical protein KIW84_072191 [Lathyrus oleraceus]|uniref:Putative plant transposon protein domain-containing protein n=1 Tax=Pisum sativum TaxID=3888 RepID=A0A9D4VMT3_PEA|nr:hypothetical protein KIW84_072191 [Pisum sativum]
MVLLFNSRLKLFPGKLKSKWSGPFVVKEVRNYGAIVIEDPKSQESWTVNGQRLKVYHSGDVNRDMSKRTKTTTSVQPRSLRRFTSDEHEERFENLIKRTIQPERLIRLLPGGTYRNVVSNFERRKWTKLCEPEATINYDIVREFYANAMHQEEGVAFNYQTRVRGRIISFGRDVINSYLGNPLTLGENERCEYRTQELANV